MAKLAIIFGVTGQDGSYLSRLLIDKGYQVVGTTRNLKSINNNGLKYLNVLNQIEIIELSKVSYEDVFQLIKKYKPLEIYNLSGQSSVAESFANPTIAEESISIFTVNILEAIKNLNRKIRFFYAASGEMFGGNSGLACNELALFNPQSPYAISKLAGFYHSRNYRAAYGIFSCSAIFFNHESPIRPPYYLAKKISRGTALIEAKITDNIKLGNLNVSRDWGFAGDYVEAIYSIMQHSQPDDFVVSTGVKHSVNDFLNVISSFVNFDVRKYVITDSHFYRPLDIESSLGCSKKALQILNWKPKTDFRALVKLMLDYDRAELNNEKS